MKCLICLRKFRQNERLVQVEKYVENAKRGDFVTSTNYEAIHFKCIAEAYNG